MSKLILKSNKQDSNKQGKRRVPLGAQRIKGVIENQEEGYHYHWINDSPGRVQQAIDGGYEMVPKDGVSVGSHSDTNNNLGSMVSQFAGRDDTGGPYNRYLMRIRQEWYDSDQAVKQASVDDTDRAIRSGKFKLGADASTSYVPKDGIKIS